MELTRGIVFAIFVSMLLVSAIAMFGILGLELNYLLLLFSAALIVPAIMPLFDNGNEINPNVVAGVAIFSLILLVLLYGRGMESLMFRVVLLFSFLIALSMPLMELRDRLFTKSSDARKITQ